MAIKNSMSAAHKSVCCIFVLRKIENIFYEGRNGIVSLYAHLERPRLLLSALFLYTHIFHKQVRLELEREVNASITSLIIVVNL
jgi:hypothetical protein